MRRQWGIVLFVAATTSLISGQQTTPSAPSQLADDHSQHVKVYAAGPGVTSPQLLSTTPIRIDSGKCKKKMDSKVIFSVLVDSLGQPRNLMFLQPLGNEMDKFALQVASSDRFTPGTHDGAPAVIGQTLEVGLQACVEEKKDDAGNKTLVYRLRSQPSQELHPLVNPPDEAVLAPKDWSKGDPNGSTGSIKAPVLLKAVETSYTKAARKAGLEGVCKISLVVDQYGMPQNIRITESLDNGLDQKAIDAVRQYRFKPAMKEGEPVPVQINVVVSFHLY